MTNFRRRSSLNGTIFLEGGSVAALDHMSIWKRRPVGDFLHIWKLLCNRVKHHCVTLGPDSREQFSLTEADLNNLLNLGNIFTDKSSISKMRYAYVLPPFSLKNCAACLRKARMSELMYLLPCALQDEVLRSPRFERNERLAKAVLSFKFLLHYFHLSFCLMVTVHRTDSKQKVHIIPCTLQVLLAHQFPSTQQIHHCFPSRSFLQWILQTSFMKSSLRRTLQHSEYFPQGAVQGQLPQRNKVQGYSKYGVFIFDVLRPMARIRI
jgi:hypothetical protein